MTRSAFSAIGDSLPDRQRVAVEAVEAKKPRARPAPLGIDPSAFDKIGR